MKDIKRIETDETSQAGRGDKEGEIKSKLKAVDIRMVGKPDKLHGRTHARGRATRTVGTERSDAC